MLMGGRGGWSGETESVLTSALPLLSWGRLSVLLLTFPGYCLGREPRFCSHVQILNCSLLNSCLYCLEGLSTLLILFEPSLGGISLISEQLGVLHIAHLWWCSRVLCLASGSRGPDSHKYPNPHSGLLR